MSKEIGNIDGVKVFLSQEQYKNYKKNLNEQIEELHDRIDKAIEYCKELMLFKKNSRQYLIGKCMLEKLGGSDKE